MWTFEHPVISTTVESTRKLIKSPQPTKKFFYVMNLEWLYMQSILYDDLQKVYTHKDIELIARSSSHFKLLESCWKKPLCTIEDFNYKQIYKLI